ncbi:hypothetical protein C9890_0040 [Perkinsus sp. BL_2016]|nr:hypothetical protein C9890_0040 [Perkinsus sp. BL_2016]
MLLALLVVVVAASFSDTNELTDDNFLEKLQSLPIETEVKEVLQRVHLYLTEYEEPVIDSTEATHFLDLYSERVNTLMLVQELLQISRAEALATSCYNFLQAQFTAQVARNISLLEAFVESFGSEISDAQRCLSKLLAVVQGKGSWQRLKYSWQIKPVLRFYVDIVSNFRGILGGVSEDEDLSAYTEGFKHAFDIVPPYVLLDDHNIGHNVKYAILRKGFGELNEIPWDTIQNKVDRLDELSKADFNDCINLAKSMTDEQRDIIQEDIDWLEFQLSENISHMEESAASDKLKQSSDESKESQINSPKSALRRTELNFALVETDEGDAHVPSHEASDHYSGIKAPTGSSS